MPLQTALTRDDTRSDDRRRLVAFADRSVVIARRVAGIAMRVQVPLASYQGVALSVREGEDGAVHKLDLRHRDPDLSIELCEARDASDLTVEWAAWAKSLSLPRLIEREARLESVDGKSPSLPAPRRRGSLVARRRTRFSRRRKTGTLQRLLIAYRDEREIISYE